MTNTIFVRTRYDYPPYRDYHRLVTLSGYPLIYVDEMDVSDPTKTYILSPKNGEWGEGWPDAKARLIWHQLEWESEPEPCPPGVAEKWTSDSWHAQRIGARFVPLGSHPSLNLNPDETRAKRYDVAFMAYTDVWRRGSIKSALEAAGLTIAPNAWGYQRHENLLQSRCIVHVHQFDDTPTIAPLRWCIAAAYSLPIISESVNSREPFGYSHFMTSDYVHLVEFVKLQLRAEYSNLEDYGHSLYRLLCVEKPFRRNVEAAL